MKNLMKRSMALLLVLFLCLSWLPANLVSVDAANYIYNWGTRGATATSLSQNAKAFYTGNNTSYDTLSELSGGTGASDAPNSSLYKALKSLMAGAQTYQTSYDATRDLYKYTDCQNGGGTISSFYSGKSIGPDWDSGKTWNREHTWPNSKGDASGNGENDIMMLRPTATSENGSRGNKAYGESSGYYDPNSVSNGQYNLHGDVARIMLYVYVRWGNTGSMWGSSGVIESLDVLIDWMEEDPVDTWEMGRNDSVQSITGTRNVFVDYPELAFLLFGEDIPNNMTTPSGEAADAVNCNHNYVAEKTVAPTCTTDGYTIYICTLCSKSYQDDKVAASHSFVNGTCTACGEIAYGVVENPVPGTAYKFGMIQENKSKTDVYYLKGGMAQTYYLDTSTDKAAAIDVYLEQTEGGYYFYTLSGSTKQYINMVVSGTHVNGAYEATASTVYTYDAASKTLIAQVDGTPYWFGTRSDKTYTTVGPCATSYQGFYCQFYGDLNQPGDPECKHSNVTVIGKKDATCTEDGHTGKTVCADCGATTDEGKTIVAFGHDYVNGTCSVCGKQESEQSALVAGKAYKFGMTQGNLNNAVYYLAGGMDGYYMATTTDVSAAIDVYVEETTGGYHFYTYVNGAKTYINMVVSGTHVNGAYEAAASTVYTYDATNDTLIAVVNGEDYWFGTRNDKTYDTMGPCKVSYAGFMGQFYDSSTEPEDPDAPACQHTTTKVEGAKAATCTEAGHTGKTVCAECGETINAGSVIPATGHSYVDGSCTKCGEADPNYGSEEPGDPAILATFTFKNGTNSQWTDGNDITDATATYKDNGYTLSFTNRSKVYSGGWDPYNNGFIKFGTSKVAGTLTFTVPDDVTSVELHLAKYKGNTSKYSINGGTAVALTKSANNGEYDVVTVDTTENKTITVSTVSGGLRMVMYSVIYKGTATTCDHTNTTVEGAVAATCTVDGHTGKTVCADCGEILNAGSVLPATGHNFVDGSCTKCGEDDPNYTPDQPTCQHQSTKVEGAAEATCTTDGHTGKTVCSDCGEILNAGSVLPATGHQNTKLEGTKAATCTEAGHTGKTVCSDCGATVNAGSVIPATGHSYVDGSCTKCGEADPNYGSEEPGDPAILATFTFKNGTNSQWTDGNDMTDSTATYTDNGYTLSFTNRSKVYFGGWDPYNNGFIKFGTSKVAGTLTFTVPYDVTSVELHLAKYKGNASKYSINGGTAVALTKSANNGEYDVVTVDTTDNKTITISTVSGGLRMVMYSVIYKGTATTCDHTNTTVEGAAAATCTVDGHTGKTVCADCGEILNAGSVLPATGHQNTKVEGAKAATCTTDGHTGKVTCTDCGEVIDEGDIVVAPGHTEVTDAAVAPTCTETGLTAGSHCSACDTVLVKQEVVAALGHTEVTDAAVAPTCTETGLTAGSHCSACDTVLVKQEVVAALGHTEVTDAAVAPTCTETGLTAGSHCSVCDTVLVKQEVVATLGHTAGAEATCTTAQTCTVCDAVLVAALGHTEVTDAAVAPTCTETGLTAGSHCSVCDTVLVKQEVVAALGHTEVTDAAVAPTCTKTGLTAGSHCSACDIVLVAQERVEALGHKAGAAATCETAQTCVRCDYVYKEALKHKYSETWNTNDEGHWHVCSQCTKKGSYADHSFENGCDLDCSVCGYTRKIEHTLDEKWSSDAKNHWHVCTECGQKQDEAAHEPGAEATATTDQVCTVCGYVIVPALGEPETEATAAPTTEELTTTGPAAPSTDDAKSGAFPWWTVIVGVVLAGGIVILIFKKKEN